MLKSRRKNFKGMGLVEVLVAVGLMAIAALGLITMLSNANKSQRSIQAKDIQREVMAEITSHLSNKTACLNSFGGNNPATSFTKTDIKDALGGAKYTIGTSHGSSLVQYQEFRIEDWVVDAGYTNQGRANLTVKLIKLGSIIGVRDIQQKIGLRVKLDPLNTISECYSIGTSSDGFWRASPTNISDIYYGGGNIGVGTTSPQMALEVNGGLGLNPTTAKPVCAVSIRGTLWFTQSGAGLKDILEICAKDQNNIYLWTSFERITFAYSGWGVCSAACGGGTQTRTCQSSGGSSAPDSSCGSAGLTQPCNTNACVTTQWSCICNGANTAITMTYNATGAGCAGMEGCGNCGQGSGPHFSSCTPLN